MSRRHYRRYNRKRSNNTELWIVMAILAIVGIALFWKILLVVALIAGVIAIVVYVVKRGGFKSSTDYEDDSEELYYENKEDNNIEEQYNQPSYKARNSIMTDCEKAFFEVFNEVLGEDYIVQPQINLASIINKESHSRYQNELFRNIDFGVFDKNYNLKLLIEINDKTHEQFTRIERDKKVRAICEEAGVELITFWTKYGINKDYIQRRLSKYLILNQMEANQGSKIN